MGAKRFAEQQTTHREIGTRHDHNGHYRSHIQKKRPHGNVGETHTFEGATIRQLAGFANQFGVIRNGAE